MSTRASIAVTEGVRVEATPFYLAEQSNPASGQFVFGYQIRISNQTDMSLQVLSRRWRIVDADGLERLVEGEGVVGQQPWIGPGESFVYSSFCPLETAWGTMEGSYTIVDQEGRARQVQVGRFYLVSAESSRPLVRR